MFRYLRVNVLEEQFYVSWPVLLLFCRRMYINLGWMLALCTLSSFAYSIWLGGKSPDTLYYHPLTRFWELLAGASIAYAHHQSGVNYLPGQIARPLVRDALSVTGLLIVISAMLTFGKMLQHPGLATLWPLGGAILLIASGPDALANRLLTSQPLVFIGLISYPLYLWHWPILSYTLVTESYGSNQWLPWYGTALAVVLAWLTYRFVELPLKFAASTSRVTTFLCVAMGVLLLASIAISKYGGLPDRSSLQYLKKYESQMVRDARQDESCLDLFKGEIAPVYCRQRNPGMPMIGLIGDSQAHALFAGVSELAERQGYGTLLLANSDCPPLLGAVTGRNDTELQLCARNTKQIVSALSNDKRIVSAIVASLGPQYLNGRGFGRVDVNYSHPLTIAEPTTTGRHQSNPEDIFSTGLVNTATLLHQHGIRVSYLLQVPELGVPAQNCVGRPLTLSQQASNCIVKYEDYQGRMQLYRTKVFGLAARVPFIRIIDTEQVFCSASGCAGFIDDQLMYADNNHLSVAGSRRVAPLVLQVALDEGPVR